jgi:hypothetical protein
MASVMATLSMMAPSLLRKTGAAISAGEWEVN